MSIILQQRIQQQSRQNRGSLQQISQDMGFNKDGFSATDKLLQFLFPALQPTISIWESDAEHSFVSFEGRVHGTCLTRRPKVR